MRLERVTGGSFSMYSAFFQTWQLGYTECAHRAFHLQMLSLYSLSISPKVPGKFLLELCVQLSCRVPLPCLSQMFHLVLQHLSYSHLAVCHRLWIAALVLSLRFSVTKYHGGSSTRIIEVSNTDKLHIGGVPQRP